MLFSLFHLNTGINIYFYITLTIYHTAVRRTNENPISEQRNYALTPSIKAEFQMYQVRATVRT